MAVEAQTDYTITGYNAYGSTSVSLAITVTNPPPIIANQPDQISLVGSLITPIFFVSTGGVPTYPEVSPNLPAGLSITLGLDSAEIFGSTLVSSSALYTVTAVNNTGSCTATVIITTSTDISLPTTIDSGMNVVLAAGEVYPIDTTLTIDGGSLDLGGTTQNIASLIVNTGSLADGNINTGSMSVTAGNISANLSGTWTFTMAPSAGTVTLSGDNTYTGGTTVSAGTLGMTDASALPNGTSLTVNAGGTFIFDPSLAAGPAVVVGGTTPGIAGSEDTTSASDNTSPAASVATSGDPSVATAASLATNPASSSLVVSASAATDVSPSARVATPASVSVPDSAGISPAQSSASVAGPPVAFPLPAWPYSPQANNPSNSIPTGALGIPATDRDSGSSIAKRAAGDLAWLAQPANSSDNWDQQRKQEAAIRALDAVFDQYGQ